MNRPPHGPHELYGHLAPPRIDGWQERMRIARETELRRQVDEAPALIAAATGLRRVMLTLHGPKERPSGVYCEGCDGSDYYGDGTPWPCTTWKTAVGYAG